MSKSTLCIFSLFLSDSVTLSLSLTHSLSHFVSFFSAVSPHNLKLTGGREGQKKKVRDLMESKEGKEKQFLRVKVAKKISIPSFVHTPLIHSLFLSFSPF